MRTDYFDNLICPTCPTTQNTSGAGGNPHGSYVTPLAPPAPLENSEAEKSGRVVAIGATPAPAYPANSPAPVPDHRTLIQTDAGVAAAAHAYHNHLFGPGQATGCCAARHARYCPEGARLREAYHTAHRQAEGLQ